MNNKTLANINEKTTKKQYKRILKKFIKNNQTLEDKPFKELTSKKIENEAYKDFKECLEALKYSNLEEKYNYIYDIAYEKLENEFKEKKICDFKNDQCIANRTRKNAHDIMGCCYYFDNSNTQKEKNSERTLCEYLKNNDCSAKCISCKFFTCKYLRDKGIRYSAKNIFILDVFLNNKQKLIVENNVLVPKEEIITKLMKDKDNKIPYFIYKFLNIAYIG